MNRELYFCLLEVNHENQLAGDDWFDYPPSYEARNPPTPDTEDSASERKFPDLFWGYLDNEDPDPRRSARNFVIECKRLGVPSKAGWVFNLKYVEQGIQRFVDPDWRYGKDVRGGAMVGYIESMVGGDILKEVNAAGASFGVPPLIYVAPPVPPLYELHHLLERTFEVTPFLLSHLWIEAPAP